jgi:hypothetical protein
MNLTLKENNINPIISVLEKVRWVEAKTMKFAPHEYTVRSTWEKDEDWIEILNIIDKLGEESLWGGKTYKYLYYNGWKYWAMHGGNYRISKIINRTRI